jgi:Uncharacterized protein conserved in bacteria (DUF2188)
MRCSIGLANWHSYQLFLALRSHNQTTGVYMSSKKVFVEKREQGDFAVRRPNSERASDVLPTQAEAITRAKELAKGGAPVVERVRNTAGGKPDQWRKA